ncbi:MAG TPA: glycosyltransferase family 4 protein, partial [Gemmatimonadaceae bacterium]|nr:glycosyltransferase family 4 protein [Gemmatimonadaceae bacterium]
DVPLIIRGSGQLESEVDRFVHANDLASSVAVVGRLSNAELSEKIRNAAFLVWPSEGYYETFGYVAVESFSLGIPVIASRAGVAGEIVSDGLTGLHFAPGSAADLADKVRWAWEHPEEMARMGMNARRTYEEKFTPAKNYDALIGVYERAISEKARATLT